MSIVITETDMGTKKKTLKAIARTYSVVNSVSRKKWDEWWNQVLHDAIELCPKLTGALSRTIRIENIGTLTMPYTAESYVGIQETNELVDKMIVAGGEIDMVTGVYVDYAEAVHDGYVSSGGNWIQGRPFLTQAIDMNLPSLNRKNEEIMNEMGKAWSE